MSKLTASAATIHVLSIAAMEEAARLGNRTADVDHLLLALTVNEQTAGQALRTAGITLGAARCAVAAQHEEQLALLGILVPARAPGKITFHETGDYEWSDGALAVLKRSAEGKKAGDAAAILRELVNEPSGLIDAVLRRLGTTPQAICDRLDEMEGCARQSEDTFESALIARSSESFVPAEVASVWSLLADPSRMAEWDPATASVDSVPAAVLVGARWESIAAQEAPDGKRIRVKPKYQRGQVELTSFEEPHRIEWRFTWPDAPKSNARLLTMQLEPAAGGTQLRITAGWSRTSTAPRLRVPLMRWLMRPAYRFVMWLQLAQIGASISRVFRQNGQGGA